MVQYGILISKEISQIQLSLLLPPKLIQRAKSSKNIVVTFLALIEDIHCNNIGDDISYTTATTIAN